MNKQDYTAIILSRMSEDYIKKSNAGATQIARALELKDNGTYLPTYSTLETFKKALGEPIKSLNPGQGNNQDAHRNRYTWTLDPWPNFEHHVYIHSDRNDIPVHFDFEMNTINIGQCYGIEAREWCYNGLLIVSSDIVVEDGWNEEQYCRLKTKEKTWLAHCVFGIVQSIRPVGTTRSGLSQQLS